MAQLIPASFRVGFRTLVLAGGAMAGAVAAPILDVPPDVPGGAPVVTNGLRYKPSSTDAVLFVTSSLNIAGRRTTLQGHAINADYVLAKYRMPNGKRRTRRIVVNQLTNSYSMKYRLLPGRQEVKLQGRRRDGTAGRVLTRVIVAQTSLYTYTGTNTVWSGGSVGGVINESFGSVTLVGGNFYNGGTLTLGGGTNLQMMGSAIRSNLDSHYEGTGRVLIGGTEVFNGGFVVRNGGVEIFVDGEWQTLEFADTDTVTFIVTPGSYNLGS